MVLIGLMIGGISVINHERGHMYNEFIGSKNQRTNLVFPNFFPLIFLSLPDENEIRINIR